MKKQIFALLVAIAGCHTAFAQIAAAPKTPFAAAKPAKNAFADNEVCRQTRIESVADDKPDNAQTIAPTTNPAAPANFEKPKIGFKTLEKVARAAANDSREKRAAQADLDYFWKYEFFGGYSYSRTDNSFNRDFLNDEFDPSFNGLARGNITANGFNVGFARNFNYLFGAKLDVSAHQSTGNIFRGNLPAVFSAGEQRYTLVNVLAGIQIKDNRKEGAARLKPFGQAMIGAGYQKFSFSNELQQQLRGTVSRFSNTEIALSIGGGVDVRLTRRVDLRLFQFDFIPLFESDPEQPEPRFEEDRILGRVQNNFRISVGIVFH